MSGVIEKLEVVDPALQAKTSEKLYRYICLRIPSECVSEEAYDQDYHRINSALRRLKLSLTDADLGKHLSETGEQKVAALNSSLTDLEASCKKVLDLLASGLKL